MNKKLLLSSTALALPLLASSVISNQAMAQREVSGSIEEVVVTAQKREENLQTVPASVSAMDATAIEKSFARDLLDVAGVSPNMIIDPVLGNGTAVVSIRGIQLAEVEKSFDPGTPNESKSSEDPREPYLDETRSVDSCMSSAQSQPASWAAR
jgi:iron complex outermembrane receptor protein